MIPYARENMSLERKLMIWVTAYLLLRAELLLRAVILNTQDIAKQLRMLCGTLILWVIALQIVENVD